MTRDLIMANYLLLNSIIICFLFFSACSSNSIKKSEPNFNSDRSHLKAENIDRKWNLEKPPSIKEISKAVKDDTASSQLENVGEWWLFGPGLGHSILNIGTVIIFPPYALYLLGNAGLALAGEEPVKIVNILPEAPRKIVNDSIDEVCSVPGRMTAALSGRDYVEDLTQNIPDISQKPRLQKTTMLKQDHKMIK